jgi:hypothetical protein
MYNTDFVSDIEERGVSEKFSGAREATRKRTEPSGVEREGFGAQRTSEVMTTTR